MLKLLFLTLLLFQDFSYEAKQTTFLEAESAKIYQSDQGVLLSVVNLNPEKKVGVELTIEGLTEDEIEVTRLIDFQGITVGVYPPTHLQPTEGVYLILGKPGERYGVRARTAEGIKQFFVELEGPTNPEEPDDPDPPPSGDLTPEDLASLQSALSAVLVRLNDPITARYISKELTSLSLSEVLEDAALEMKLAIGKGLVESMKEVKPPYKNWSLFRDAIDKQVTKLVEEGKVKNGKDLSKVKDVVVASLAPTSRSNINGVIHMYTRPNCAVCTKWKNEVYPALKEVGWKLQEIVDEPDGFMDFVPRFVVCDNNKCSDEVIGYMDMVKFRTILNEIR